jgi:hypothetical protein
MSLKPIVISILCVVLFVAAVYFGGKWVLEAERVEEWKPAVRPDTPDDENETAPDTQETEAEKPPPLRADTSRGYRSIEELLSDASPEERRRYAEIGERIRAEADAEEEARRLNPSPQDIADAKLLERVEKGLKEMEALIIGDPEKDAEVEERIRTIEKRRAERARELEEARQFQAESHQVIKELIEAYKRRGLWDYDADKPIGAEKR